MERVLLSGVKINCHYSARQSEIACDERMWWNW
jgi:hypothetical protein